MSNLNILNIYSDATPLGIVTGIIDGAAAYGGWVLAQANGLGVIESLGVALSPFILTAIAMLGLSRSQKKEQKGIIVHSRRGTAFPASNIRRGKRK